MPFNSPGAPISRKTVTFTGAAGLGAVGAVPLFTVTGRIAVDRISAYCSTDLTEAGATATIALGTTTNTSRFIAATTATAIDAGEIWLTTTPTAGSLDFPSASAGATDPSSVMVSENIIATVAAQAVNGGVMEFYLEWTPLSAGASVT